MRLVLAIDIGTSSTRAALVDASLIVHSLAARTYPLHTPQPGWAEQDAEEIARAVDDAVRECVASMPQGGEILAVCIDAAMHSLVLLDDKALPSLPFGRGRTCGRRRKRRGSPPIKRWPTTFILRRDVPSTRSITRPKSVG